MAVLFTKYSVYCLCIQWHCLLTVLSVVNVVGIIRLGILYQKYMYKFLHDMCLMNKFKYFNVVLYERVSYLNNSICD